MSVFDALIKAAKELETDKVVMLAVAIVALAIVSKTNSQA